MLLDELSQDPAISCGLNVVSMSLKEAKQSIEEGMIVPCNTIMHCKCCYIPEHPYSYYHVVEGCDFHHMPHCTNIVRCSYLVFSIGQRWYHLLMTAVR
jgi:hypothetical protein